MGFNRIDNEFIKAPSCLTCKHLISFSDKKCEAFEEIPEDILMGNNKHTQNIPGDKGIRYEKSESF